MAGSRWRWVVVVAVTLVVAIPTLAPHSGGGGGLAMVLHGVGGVVLGVGYCWGFGGSARGSGWAVGVAFGVVVVLEMVQGPIAGRTPQVVDVVASWSGVVIGGLGWWVRQ